MALQFIKNDSVPNYICLSTDISSTTLTGVGLLGSTVLATDTGNWYIVTAANTISPYAIPASFSGSIALGTIDISQVTPGTTNGVVMAASAAVTDGIGNYGAITQAPGSVASAPLVIIPLCFNGATFDKQRSPSTFKDLASINISSIATVWTPAAGKKFRLMGGTISVSGACSVLFEDNVGGATIFRTPALLTITPYSFSLGNGILSGVADRVLKATASSGTVSIIGTLYGTEE